MYAQHKYWLPRTNSHTKPECGVIPATAHSFCTKPNLREVMWISRCGKPVSVCDGSDSDCWLMERGYITCVGECVHGGCNGHLYNPPPLSRVPVAQHKHHESQHQTLRSLWGALTKRNQASWLTTASVVLVLPVVSFFADLSIYGLGQRLLFLA